MKKFTLLFMLLLTAGVTFGQFDLGIKAGYTAAKLSTDVDTIKADFSSGFHLGIFARIGKKFYVQPEAYYNFQTSSMQGIDDAAEWKQKIKVGSLDIPVLVGFKLIDAKLLNLRLMLGPMASFVVNKNIEDMNSALGPIEEADINTVNWALQVGLGADISFITLDVRYQYGLNKILEEIQVTSVDANQSLWVVSLGFKIL
jgi:hypothetical protein